MIIARKEYIPVVTDVMKFIANGKIPEPARLQFQRQQNLVADEIGLSYTENAGLLDIFEFCEQNNIDDELVHLLLSSLKYQVQHVKYLHDF